MTLFVSLRASTRGGIVAAEAHAMDDGVLVSAPEFASRVEGRNVLLATHGFNVDQEDGVRALSLWSTRLALDGTWLFVGVLWPGDSKYVPILDYPYEGVEAIASGKILAAYLNANATRATGFALASHSLGVRVVLETIRHLDRAPVKTVLLAPAIENDALAREYHDAAQRVSTDLRVIASKRDAVLEYAFPAGNLVGQIIMHGHPYDRTALGRNGPLYPLPGDVHVSAWQIPVGWDYGHLDYLPKQAVGAPINTGSSGPGPADAIPVAAAQPGIDPWKPSWSAGAVSKGIA